MVSAHVWAWRHFVGPQNGLDTLHRCDNRLCVRHDTHLFVGTRGENNRDRVAKGRSAIGEKSGRALLTEAQVRDIRSIWATGGISETALGAQFGVSRGAVRSILSGATWKHVG